jgi:DNA polymerase III sliding clamp (beta) subunit (PCNA family)
MNIQLTVDELLEPLQTVIGVVENKPTLPILSHVLIHQQLVGKVTVDNVYKLANFNLTTS